MLDNSSPQCGMILLKPFKAYLQIYPLNCPHVNIHLRRVNESFCAQHNGGTFSCTGPQHTPLTAPDTGPSDHTQAPAPAPRSKSSSCTYQALLYNNTKTSQKHCASPTGTFWSSSPHQEILSQKAHSSKPEYSPRPATGLPSSSLLKQRKHQLAATCSFHQLSWSWNNSHTAVNYKRWMREDERSARAAHVFNSKPNGKLLWGYSQGLCWLLQDIREPWGSPRQSLQDYADYGCVPWFAPRVQVAIYNRTEGTSRVVS